MLFLFYIYKAGFRAFVLCESSSGFVLNWLLDRSPAVVKKIVNFKILLDGWRISETLIFYCLSL